MSGGRGETCVDGSEADTEWSEEDIPALTSLHSSVTVTSEAGDIASTAPRAADDLDAMKSRGSRNRRHRQVSLDAYMGDRFDPANDIMDRIDHELRNVSPIPMMKSSSKKPSRTERQKLRDEGVEFDTGDETNHEARLLLENLGKLRSDKSGGGVDEGDTGLGTGSVDGEMSERDGRSAGKAHIIGKVDVYSGDSSEEPDIEAEDDELGVLNLSSKRFMSRAKKGRLFDQTRQESKTKILSKGVLHPQPQLKNSDHESVRTEDFEAKFRALSPAPIRGRDIKVRALDDLSDKESIMTEDIEHEYRKTLINPVLSESPVYRLKRLSQEARQGVKKGNKFRSASGRPHAKSRSKMRGGASDRESVRTEDFENQFQGSMVKQVANIPITNFDKFMVDSDLDTVRSQVVHDRFQAAMNKPSGFGCGDSDFGSVSDAESARIEALVEKKFQEILRLTQLAEEREEATSPVRAAHGTLQDADSDADDETPVSTPRPVSPSRRQQSRNTSLRSGSPSVTPKPAPDLGDDERKMERESARIRKEVEADHRKRYGQKVQVPSEKARSPSRSPAPSPVRGNAPTPTKLQQRPALTAMQAPSFQSTYTPSKTSAINYKVDVEVAMKLQQELAKLQGAIRKSKSERLSLQGDVQSLQSVIKQHQIELNNTECKMKENSTKAEDVRTELMLAEFKRDSAKKELEKIEEAVKDKRIYLGELDDKVTETDATATETEDGQSKPLSRQELLSQYTNMRHRIQQLEAKDRERRELEAQLDITRDSILAEQKRARQQIDSLKEELDAKDNKLEEVNNDKDSLVSKLSRLEVKFKTLEEERDEVLQDTPAAHSLLLSVLSEFDDKSSQEKTSQYNNLKAQLQEQLSTAKASSTREAADLRLQLQTATEQMTQLHAEITRREEANNQLREQIAEVKQQMTNQSNELETLHESHRKEITRLNEDHESSIREIRLRTAEEKMHAVEELKSSLEQEKSKLLEQTELHLTEQLTDLQGQLTGKDIEVQVLKDRIKQQELAARQLADKVKAEAHEKLRSLVAEERDRWEADKATELDQSLNAMRAEMERTSRTIREDLTAERDLTQQQLRHIESIKQELEEARQQSRQAYREKVQAMTAAKETAELDKERQLELIKEKLENETGRANDRMRESLRKQEEEIARLRKERKDLEEREVDNATVWERQDKAILDELNEECRKIATALGVTPRTVTYPNWTAGQTAKTSPSVRSPLRSAITAAMSNLRSVTDDLRKAVNELKEELETQKRTLNKIDKNKKEELDMLKKKMQGEKLQALETLKDRLIQILHHKHGSRQEEHLHEVDRLHKSLGKGKTLHKSLREKDSELKDIQGNMTKWKDQTTERLAKKFQEELARELDKRAKEHKKQKMEWEREKLSQQREIERLEREVKRNTTNLNGSAYGTNARTRSSGPPVSSPLSKSQGLSSESHLRSKFKAEGSLSRSKQFSGSTPDLAALNGSYTDLPIKDTSSNSLASTIKSTPSSPVKQDLTSSLLREAGSSASSTVGVTGGPGTSTPNSLALRQLELQVQRAENRAKLAEQRAEKNETLLNQKLLETSKLQGSLTYQSKELMQLERAYQQLQTKGSSTRRPPTPTRNTSHLGLKS